MVFEDLGEQLVKNIAHPIRAFRLRIAACSQEDPSEFEETSEAPEVGSPAMAMPEVSADTQAALELAFWESVRDGTATELESYLERYPEGTFAPLARARLEAGSTSSEISSEPATAVAELSADTEATLELAFWESVKDGTPAELESYLGRYPDGTFAPLARTRLNSTEHLGGELSEMPSVAAEPDELDLAFWNSVKDSYRREELQAYLEQHPNGHFAALARARLSSLDAR
jgi:hypothetical protein